MNASDRQRRAPGVHILALGGTIAMTGDPDSGVRPALSADALVEAVPGLDAIADIGAESFRSLPGAHLQMSDLVALSHAVAGRDEDGFVVTQGTDTIEETAFALDLLHDGDAPLVVTGAMRNPTMPGADGPANLAGAVRVASSSAARGQGVLVVFDDTVHAARFVRKSHAFRPSAFTSAGVGPLGWVTEDRVRLPLAVRRRVHVDVRPDAPLPRVSLLTAVLDDDGGLLPAVSEADGLVIEAMGVGHLPANLIDAVTAAAQRIPVLFATRTGAGETHRATYGFPGSERDLLERGLIGAGALDGLKARVLLRLALAAGWSRDRVSETIDILSG